MAKSRKSKAKGARGHGKSASAARRAIARAKQPAARGRAASKAKPVRKDLRAAVAPPKAVALAKAKIPQKMDKAALKKALLDERIAKARAKKAEGKRSTRGLTAKERALVKEFERRELSPADAEALSCAHDEANSRDPVDHGQRREPRAARDPRAARPRAGGCVRARRGQAGARRGGAVRARGRDRRARDERRGRAARAEGRRVLLQPALAQHRRAVPPARGRRERVLDRSADHGQRAAHPFPRRRRPDHGHRRRRPAGVRSLPDAAGGAGLVPGVADDRGVQRRGLGLSGVEGLALSGVEGFHADACAGDEAQVTVRHDGFSRRDAGRDHAFRAARRGEWYLDRQGAQDSWMHHAWPRAKEQPVRGNKVLKRHITPKFVHLVCLVLLVCLDRLDHHRSTELSD